jgi:hypothetical protein
MEMMQQLSRQKELWGHFKTFCADVCFLVGGRSARMTSKTLRASSGTALLK